MGKKLKNMTDTNLLLTITIVVFLRNVYRSHRVPGKRL